MQTSSRQSDYRPDIDGIRALAVLAVVVFHALPSVLPGGFVGVDVFFVISGYLITRIIARESDAGAFSFARFYVRRARRIFPALALVLVTSLLIGAATLPPGEMQQLGSESVAGVLFSSNLWFWREAGYFDTASASKPLLHLWSLGIEEQFYLLWPVIVLALARLRRARMPIVAALGLTSFALGVLTLQSDPTQAFYSPLLRVGNCLRVRCWRCSRSTSARPTKRRSGATSPRDSASYSSC